MKTIQKPARLRRMAARKPAAAAADSIALAIILDESGSMGACWDATIAGVNEYLQDARGEGLDYRVYLTKFDTEYTPLHAGARIAEVPALDRSSYTPRGSTALHDAVCKTIREVDALKTDSVVFVIVTDGGENSSREHTLEDVKRLVAERESRGWAFAYIGANIDAYAVGGAMGFTDVAQYHATEAGTSETWSALSYSRMRHAKSHRSGIRGAQLREAAKLTDEERKRLEKTE